MYGRQITVIQCVAIIRVHRAVHPMFSNWLWDRELRASGNVSVCGAKLANHGKFLQICPTK